MNMWVSYILHVPCNTTISFALPFSYALIGLRDMCSLLIGSWEICTWQHRLGTAYWVSFWGLKGPRTLQRNRPRRLPPALCPWMMGCSWGGGPVATIETCFSPVVNGELRINPAPLVAKSPPLLGRNRHRYAEDLNFGVGNTCTHLASVLNLITEFDLDTMLPRLCLCDPPSVWTSSLCCFRYQGSHARACNRQRNETLSASCRLSTARHTWPSLFQSRYPWSSLRCLPGCPVTAYRMTSVWATWAKMKCNLEF